MYIVYALYNKTVNKLYIGQTKNLEERLDWHNNKIFKSSFTAKNPGKWELIYKEETGNREEALRRERQLKSGQGRIFLKRIAME